MPDRYDEEARRLLGGDDDPAMAEARALLDGPAPAVSGPKGGAYVTPQGVQTNNPHHYRQAVIADKRAKVVESIQRERAVGERAAYEDDVRRRYVEMRLPLEDSKAAAGQGGLTPLEIEREVAKQAAREAITPTDYMARALDLTAKTTAERSPSTLETLVTAPARGIGDIGEAITRKVSGLPTPRPSPEMDFEATEARMGTGGRFATGLLKGAGQMAVLGPAAKLLGGGTVGWTAVGGGTGALMAEKGKEAEGAAKGASTALLSILGMRGLSNVLPGNAYVRIPVAGAASGAGAEVAVDLATGEQITGEQLGEAVARNLVFSLNDVPQARRAEVLQRVNRVRATNAEQRAATKAITAQQEAARAALPPLTQAQAGEVNLAVLRGGLAAPEEIVSREVLSGLSEGKSLAEAVQAPRGERGDGTRGDGYDPNALAAGKVEPGARKLVAEARAMGYQTANSSQESPVTGKPMTAALSPDGRPVVLEPGPDGRPVERAPVGSQSESRAPDAAGADDLPDYLRHVKVTAKRLTGPMRPKGSSLEPMRATQEGAGERGFVSLGGAGKARPVGEGGGAKDVLVRAFGQALSRVKGKSGGVGDMIYELGRDAQLVYRHLRNKFGADQALKAASNPRAAVKAQRLVPLPSRRSFDSNYTRWVVGEDAPSTPQEAAIADTADAFFRNRWNYQAEHGMTRMEGGQEVPMRAYSGRTRTIPHAHEAEWFDILAAGERDPRWQIVAEEIAAHPANKGATVPEVETWLRGKREQMFDESGVGLEGHIASEYQRQYRVPDAILYDGKTHLLNKVHPYDVINQHNEQGAQALSVDVVFGRGKQSKVRQLRDDFLAKSTDASPDAAKADVRAALRGLSGLSPEQRVGRQRGIMHGIRRGYDTAAGLYRAGKRTLAPLVEMGETLWSGVFLRGIAKNTANLAESVVDSVRTFVGAPHTKGVEATIRTGAYTDAIHKKGADIHANPVLDGIQRFSRGIQRVFAGPAQEIQERMAALSGEGLKKDIRAGRGLEDVGLAQRMEMLGLMSFDEAMAWQRGGLPVETEARLASRVAELPSMLTSANTTAAQKSAFQQSPTARRIITFLGYASTKARLTGRVIDTAFRQYRQGMTLMDDAGRPISKGEGARRASSALRNLTRYAMWNALMGATTEVALALAGPGPGVDDLRKKIEKDPAGYIAETATFQMLAGWWGTMIRSTFNGNLPVTSTLPGGMADTAVSLTKGAAGDDKALQRGLKRVAPIAEYGIPEKERPRGRTSPRRPREGAPR